MNFLWINNAPMYMGDFVMVRQLKGPGLVQWENPTKGRVPRLSPIIFMSFMSISLALQSAILIHWYSNHKKTKAPEDYSSHSNFWCISTIGLKMCYGKYSHFYRTGSNILVSWMLSTWLCSTNLYSNRQRYRYVCCTALFCLAKFWRMYLRTAQDHKYKIPLHELKQFI